MSESKLIARAQGLLEGVRGRTLSMAERRDKAIDLASWLVTESANRLTSTERNVQAQLAGMMRDAHGKAFTTAMTDQCFRSSRPSRVADQLVYLLGKYGVPRFLPFETRWKLGTFKALGTLFPRLFVPAARLVLRREMRRVVVPGEPDRLTKFLKQRFKAGVRINLNHIGEAILSEDEAERRLHMYLDSLADPCVEYVSVKISSICSQINLIAKDETLKILKDRLRRLYRAAAKERFTRPDGSVVTKFVNLDMEEYRDLHLTMELFQSVLSEPEFFRFSAGLVLQAYLPDSYLIQQELTVWAMKRVAQGGAPIKIRLVKGANLAMERVESSLHSWRQAPYDQKIDVDANYKRMLDYGTQPDHARAARIAVGSHNLFDIAYAMLIREERSVAPHVSFEMLEGMADHIRRTVFDITGDILLYAPSAKRKEFVNAVSYLIRRLDENTADDNFLRHSFDLEPGSPVWEEQVRLFSEACNRVASVSHSPRRSLNRFDPPKTLEKDAPFANDASTDWALEINQQWARRILGEWHDKRIEPIACMIAGQPVLHASGLWDGFDPSRPGYVPYQYSLATEEDAEAALACAVKAQEGWAKTTPQHRSDLAARLAQILRERRADFIGAMVLDGGKTVPEADAELSEAIDFAEYYRRSLFEWQAMQGVQWKPKGTILVTPPWNFPCAIPLGGAVAALLTGNTVLFKPAQETVLVGSMVAQALWDAGFPKEALQLIVCDDEPVGTRLIQDPRVNAVILTGGTATARLFLKLRPGIDLMAETGGKNAIIGTSMSDRDLLIKDLVQSAFGHAGQKCSAASLAVLEAEVYDDPRFMEQLREAAASWAVGSAWEPKTKVNPLILPPGETLLRGLTELEEGEEWLLEPKKVKGQANLWTPGIKVGVRPGNFTFDNELFGPVLSIVRAQNLEDALHIVNGTRYGLTSGLQSLDRREQELWRGQIQAGNCYINRGITGAIVQRQPFGGTKDSAFGHGYKAGGPNYLLQLMHASSSAELSERCELQGVLRELSQKSDSDVAAALESYAYWWQEYFSMPHDPSKLIGQDNELVYRPRRQETAGACVRVRLNEGDRCEDAVLLLGAALLCGAELKLSVPVSMQEAVSALGMAAVVVESDAQFVDGMASGKGYRFVSCPSEDVLQAMADKGCQVLVVPVQRHGRLELPNFLQEVAFSTDYHRYGNLGDREHEERRPLD